MRITVVIPTVGRKELVTRTLSSIERQTRAPDRVIVSTPDESHVLPFHSDHFPVAFVYGTKGLCAQRNRAIDVVADDTDIITFFDDDFIAAPHYLERLEAAFAEHPDWAVVTGPAVYDGITGRGYSFDEGMELLEEAAKHYSEGRPENTVVRQRLGGYGCNMSIRAALIGDLRFDERLPLYGWQEDVDFTAQLHSKGAVVGVSSIYGVHLGVKGGRVSGLRFGYSQVANPVYLVKKGSLPAYFGYQLMARNLIANLVKSLWSEPWVDRRGRLRGNLIALSHVLRGRIEPEYILKL